MNPDEIRQLAELLQREPGLKAIDFKEVRRLAQLLRESPEIGSIEIKGWLGTGVIITRTSAGVAPVAMPLPIPAVPPALPHAAPHAAPAAAAPATDGGRPADGTPPAALKEIKSPMVGTFYKAPEPGAEPYVKAGSRITPGQTVCIIEAMKIMNEIEAELAGVIREVCVEDTQPVEFGQVLFRVDPNG
jgi:acetyl-CoA carboxylase biotin carboxyl carrier protein